MTALIQSSSASVGILQALSATGSVTYAIAVPIIIGQNIGKCFTIILGGIGADRKAKRVSLTYLLFNLLGAFLFSTVIYLIYYTFGIPFFEKVVNRGNIANLHLMFNLVTSMILLPFSDHVTELTGKILREEESVSVDKELQRLDPMLLSTPGIALQQSIQVINVMGQKILENFQSAAGLISEYQPSVFNEMKEKEDFIDRCETVLSDYVVKIDRRRLTRDNKLVVLEILNSIGDFERIGDYCINMAYAAQGKDESGIKFSEVGKAELAVITEASRYTLKTVIKAFSEDNGHEASRVEPLADTIDQLKEIIKAHHVERLQEGTCSVEGGVALLDLINCFERIASHASNIALHIVKRTTGDREFDEMHGHIYNPLTEEYQALLNYYRDKYILPIDEIRLTAAVSMDQAPVTPEPVASGDKETEKESVQTADQSKEMESVQTADKSKEKDPGPKAGKESKKKDKSKEKKKEKNKK